VNKKEPYEAWKLIDLKDAFLNAHNLKTWNHAKAKFTDKIEEKLSNFVLENAELVVRTARVAPKDVNESARAALKESTMSLGVVQRSKRTDRDDYFFLNGEQLIFYQNKTKIIDGKISTATPLTNLWDDILSNNLHNEGGVRFPNGKKPEGLIKRCLEVSTNPGDLVLDSFAGSGTTGAVAHKMGRRWIMVELGEHCHTHIIPRLKRVIDGEDSSGITKVVNWKGGGGFRYYHLAPSLLEKDKWGNWVINKTYNAAMLAEALCKLEGFTYAPSDSIYWQHGYSTENDFIYVTTANLNHDQLQQLSDEVGPDRSLLVLCTAFRARADRYPNLTVKKIPKAVLTRCEWGHDDYSLRVENLPKAPRAKGQMGLFGLAEEDDK
jgi:adenine-specific DNA-methyltransferase